MKLPLLSNKVIPILSGIEIGVPLNLISKIYSNVNFQDSIISYNSILFNFLLGFSTYKSDRYLDSLEYFNNNNNLLDLKHDYYLSILNNEKHIQFVLFCSYISICIFIVYYKLGIVLPMFISTFTYKEIKQNKNISFLKPFFVAGMWTFTCCIIPLLFQNNYLNYLNFDDYYHLLSPTFLSLFSTTNLADLKDINEDILNGINTLPIILGPQKIKVIIFISSILSLYIFTQSEYFTWSLQNIFFISSNIFPNLNLINNTVIK